MCLKDNTAATLIFILLLLLFDTTAHSENTTAAAFKGYYCYGKMFLLLDTAACYIFLVLKYFSTTSVVRYIVFLLLVLFDIGQVHGFGFRMEMVLHTQIGPHTQGRFWFMFLKV